MQSTSQHFIQSSEGHSLVYKVECYPWSGEMVKHKRRDKRRGHHLGRVERIEKGAMIQ
jgi:hypothetical protein